MTARDLQTLFARAAGEADARTDADLLAHAADPAAFAELVRRHGPLVWAACRRLLPAADAADAFQAAFLALLRSAARVREPAAVGGWLHTAAVRAARAARRSAARRRLREGRVARPEAVTPVADAAWDAMLEAVHEEVERLPAGERTAFVLCELQGVSAGEAAVRLGWKPGTLTGRLSKARAKLLARLSGRGIVPAAGLAGVGTLAVPAEVVARVVASAGPAAVVSPAVLALSREVTAMIGTNHLAAVVLVAGGLLAGAGGVLTRLDAQEPGRPGGLPPSPTAQKPAGGAGMPGMSGMPPGMAGKAPGDLGVPVETLDVITTAPRTRWEYTYDAKPENRIEFMQLVITRGQQGWELATVVTLADAAPPPFIGGLPGGMGMGGEGGGGTAGRMAGMMGGMGGGPMATTAYIVFKRPVAAGSSRKYEGVESVRPAGAGPKETGANGLLSIPLKYAKATEVARVVKDLLAPSEGGPPVPGMGGGGMPSRFAVAAVERQNLLLVRLDGTGRPTEQQVRELVAELDVPDAKPANPPAK